MRLLLVEPDTRLSELLQAGLRRAGYEIDVAGDAEQAARRAASYDLIVLDFDAIRSPGEIAALRERAGTPLLVLATRGVEDAEDAVGRAGVNGWLAKPFELADLVDRIERLRGRRTPVRGSAAAAPNPTAMRPPAPAPEAAPQRPGSWLVRAGAVAFRRRGLLLPVAVMLLLLPSPRIASSAAAMGAVGFAVALLGQAVRIGVIGFVYIVRGGKDRRVHAEELVTEGAYALCRNPMYLGNLLLLLGLAIAANSWLFALLGVPLALLSHVLIVAAEEDFLRRKFGRRYDEYCRRTPRLLPRLGGLAALRGREFDWGRVLANEYKAPFDWLAGLAVVVLANLAAEHSLARHPGLAAVMAATILGRLLLWNAARRRAARPA